MKYVIALILICISQDRHCLAMDVGPSSGKFGFNHQYGFQHFHQLKPLELLLFNNSSEHLNHVGFVFNAGLSYTRKRISTSAQLSASYLVDYKEAHGFDFSLLQFRFGMQMGFNLWYLQANGISLEPTLEFGICNAKLQFNPTKSTPFFDQINAINGATNTFRSNAALYTALGIKYSALLNKRGTNWLFAQVQYHINLSSFSWSAGVIPLKKTSGAVLSIGFVHYFQRTSK